LTPAILAGGMASEEDLAALRLFYREVARGNFWVGKDVFDPDIEWEWSSSLGAITGSRTYRGFDEVSAATKDWLRSFEWFRIELQELVDMGEKVVALTRSLGRPHGATSDVTALNAEVWRMRDGKAIAHRSYDTWEEALEAAKAPD
jgi:ketosteroid isomerase-like protein